jgi:hypothetical protein
MRARYRDGYLYGQTLHQTTVAQASPSSLDCSREVNNRSGSSDFSRCHDSGATIACYLEVKETCRDHSTGALTTRSFREYTGRCAESYSGCW